MVLLTMLHSTMVNLTRRKILEILFEIVEWLAWIALIIGVITFVKGVYFEYKTKDTSIKVATKKMTEIENPTITLCFQPYVKYSELNSFNLSYSNFLNFEIPLKNLSMDWQDFYNRVTYKIGRDFNIYMSINNDYYLIIIDNANLTKPYSDWIELEEVYTLFTGLCYKITPKIKTSGGLPTSFILNFDETMPKYNIPKIEMFLTSEENSYGIISSQWDAGDVFRLDIEPYKRYKYKLQLVPEKYEKLKWTSNCSEDGSYISRLSTKYVIFVSNYIVNQILIILLFNILKKVY